MNLLQNLYVSESITDIFILKFGLFFSLLLILPYLSLVIGSLLFSLLHVSKSKIYKNNEYFDFAKYSIDVAVKKMPVRIFFGILPYFGAAYFYSQLYPENLTAPENLLFGFLLFAAGLCISVVYKDSFSLKDPLSGSSRFKLFVKSGWFGALILLVSAYILIGYLQVALTPNALNDASLSAILFSTSSIVYYLLFLSISFSITSAVIIARLNKTKKEYNFMNYGKEFSSKTGILFTFIQPLLFVLSVVSVSNNALSFPFFFNSLLVLLIMLAISIQFYINYRDHNLKSTSIVFLFLLLFSVLIYNSQLTAEKVEYKEAVKKGKVLNIFL